VSVWKDNKVIQLLLYEYLMESIEKLRIISEIYAYKGYPLPHGALTYSFIPQRVSVS
jgi:hypothetical protein